MTKHTGKGDIVSGDKIGGDKIKGNKTVNFKERN